MAIVVEMSQVEGTKRAGRPRRGAVKAQIFSAIYNGIRSTLLGMNSDGAEAGEGQCVPCGDSPNSGPLDTSMMVKEA